MVFPGFVGTGTFFITYSDVHAKYTRRQAHKLAIIFNKTLFLSLKSKETSK